MKYTPDALRQALDWAWERSDTIQSAAMTGGIDRSTCLRGLWLAGDELAGKVTARVNVVLVDNPAESLVAIVANGTGALHGTSLGGVDSPGLGLGRWRELRDVLCDQVYAPKNADYGDAFAVCGVPGICVRLLDKHLRLSNLIMQRGLGDLRQAMVLDESIDDTIQDMTCYAGMGIMLLREQARE